MLKTAAAGLVVVLLLLGLLAYSQSRPEPLKVSGFLEADEIRPGSRVGGRVLEVRVEEGDGVSAGDVLIALEPFDLQERKAEAEANLAAREADLKRLVAGFRAEEIAQARARVEQLEAQLEQLVNGPLDEEINAAKARLELAAAQLQRARSAYERTMRLYSRATDAVSRDTVDRTTEELKVAESMKEVRQQELALLERGTREEEIDAAKAELEQARQAWLLAQNGYRPEEIEKARASVAAARAELEALQVQLSELQIRSPVNGVVEAVDLRKGDLVGANAPALSILDKSRLWVRAYVPTTRLNLRMGQELQVTVDGFGERRFRGRVVYVARQAEFTPNNVQTLEDRSQLAFRIKVMLEEGLDELRPGMTADVWLDGGESSDAARGD